MYYMLNIDQLDGRHWVEIENCLRNTIYDLLSDMNELKISNRYVNNRDILTQNNIAIKAIGERVNLIKEILQDDY